MVSENNSPLLRDSGVRKTVVVRTLFLGEYPGVIMTIVLKRKINYHLLQTYLPSGERSDLLVTCVG